MTFFENIPLKKRLVISFATVVILASVLSTIVFTFVLVSNMKRSARDKIEETLRVAETHVATVVRGLEIYADLIASDLTFGQVLSYDSAFGIKQKIEEFKELSRADVVAFLPRPEQYIEIRDRIFLNAGNEDLEAAFLDYPPLEDLLEPTRIESSKGWIVLGERIYLAAMKPILYFGAHMGVIVLARHCETTLASEIASAAGAGVIVFDSRSVFGSSLLRNGVSVPSILDFLRNKLPEMAAMEHDPPTPAFAAAAEETARSMGAPVAEVRAFPEKLGKLIAQSGRSGVTLESFLAAVGWEDRVIRSIPDQERLYRAGAEELGAAEKRDAPDTASAVQRVEHHVEDNYILGEKSYLSLFAPLLGVDGSMAAVISLKVSNETIQQTRNRTVQRVLLVAALATLLAAVLGYYLARAIANPLLDITKGMHTIMAQGDMSIRVPTEYGAEIGVLSQSFNGLLTQLQDAHEKLAASERRMKQELTMASTVQEMLFPERSVQYEGIKLASFIDASSETGGDWFGYGQDRLASHVTVLIGDVTGHGMPAALITAITNGFFTGVAEVEDAVRRTMTDLPALRGTAEGERLLAEILPKLQPDRHLTTAEMLAVLNQILLRSTKGSLMMTFFASVYDPKKRELRYANAGHNRPFLVTSKNGGRPEVTVLKSPASHRLGETENVSFDEHSLTLSPGDMVVWYTDGILECENPSGEMYGKRRFTELLKREFRQPPDVIRDRAVEEAYAFFAGHPRKDDITLVVGKAG